MEELIKERLGLLEKELDENLERLTVQRLEAEMEANRETFFEATKGGFRNHLERLKIVLQPPSGSPLSSLLSTLVMVEFSEDNAERLKEGLAEVERLKVPFIHQHLEALTEEHRTLTLSQVRGGLSERQGRVVAEELRKLEGRMEALEAELPPLSEGIERLNAEYRALVEAREAALKAMQGQEERAKCAALAAVYSKIFVFFKKENEGRKGRGRHGRVISVWEPEKTLFMGHDGIAHWIDRVVCEDSLLKSWEQPTGKELRLKNLKHSQLEEQIGR
jgi:hypothetical protein